MKLEDFKEKFTLHDSGIEQVLVLEDKRELRLLIDLCNYDQTWYKDDSEPEHIQGWLIFNEVVNFSMEPLVQEIDGQILTTTLEAGTLKIIFSNFSVRAAGGIQSDTVWITVEAANVEWCPIEM